MGIIKKLFKFVFFVLVIVMFTSVGLAWMITDDEPVVASKPRMTFADIRRAQALWKQYHPRQLVPGKRYIVPLTSNEMDLILAFASTQIGSMARANLKLRVGEEGVLASTSYPIELGPFKRFANVELLLDVESGQLPTITDVQLSSLSVPDLLVANLYQRGKQGLGQDVERFWAESRVEVLPIENGMSLGFTWRPDLASELTGMGGDRNREAAQRFRDQLVLLAAQNNQQGSKWQLENLIATLLEQAAPRSEDEVTAMLTVLAHYVSGNSVSELYDLSGTDPVRVRVYLGGHQDLARHFLISAMLAATAGVDTAGRLGVLKELSDADNKATGFSGVDLLANRAGIQFQKGLLASVESNAVAKLPGHIDGGLFPGRDQQDILQREPRSYWSEQKMDELLTAFPFYQATIVAYDTK